jgi:hypothetical protein
MIKRLFFILIFLVLVACGSAPGSEGGDCLEGNTCEHDYLVCGADGKCVICGFEGDPCCDDGTCRENHVCGSDGFCGPCGWDGVACCEGGTCQEGHACGEDGMCHMCGYSGSICCPDGSCNSGYVCSSENECVSCGFLDQPCCDREVCDEGYICSEEGSCETCGYAGDLCCPGETCREWNVCTPSGLCEDCGELGQLSCQGPICKGWYLPHNGMCQNPFEVAKNTSLSLCEQTEPGEVERHDRDWCYWYAAYWKMDPTICENIEWEQMKIVCEKGENPDDFDVTWIVK